MADPSSAKGTAALNATPSKQTTGQAATPGVGTDVQLLTLKVMRLTKPNLTHSAPISVEEADIPTCQNGTVLTAALEHPNITKIAQDKSLPHFSLSEVFGLPQSFGSIFLGEAFCSYLSVFNESKDIATKVQVTAELQTGNDRTLVTDPKAKPKESLAPGESVDTIVRHEVKELGTHLLVCNVTYNTEGGETKSFRKFFRFQVYKPLDIKTMVYNIENDVILEAQIQNITQSPMFIERVNVLGTHIFTTKDYNTIDGDLSTTSFDTQRYLSPQDVRQYLFCLSVADSSNPDEAMAATSIGKLEIVWRTNLGELGRLQTNELPRMPIVGVLVAVDTLESPSNVIFGQAFQIKCNVTNKTSNTMDLSIVVIPEKAGSICYVGVSNRRIGNLKPDTSQELHLELMALGTGLQQIRGLGVFDSKTNKVHELSTLPNVFVSSA